jgi:hypothetical protein
MLRKNLKRKVCSQAEACQSKSMIAQAQTTVPPAIVRQQLLNLSMMAGLNTSKTLFDVLTC